MGSCGELQFWTIFGRKMRDLAKKKFPWKTVGPGHGELSKTVITAIFTMADAKALGITMVCLCAWGLTTLSAQIGLTRTTKRQNTYQRKLMIHKKGP